MMFGAWRTAFAASILNLALLSLRIRVEERALDGATPIPSARPPDGAR
jgi:isoprenylcysteine carboxyl methyltransferase (ICMT) family protein YpbQ